MGSIFYTIKNSAQFEYVEKKSKFISSVFKIATEEEAQEHIKEFKKKFWNASHNVYAYKVREGNIQRFSDDGEPSGTAGRPILEVILKKELEDVLVIVTRYFGGVKLGASGLVRAYGKSAQLGLGEAQVVKKELSTHISIVFDYKYEGSILKNLDKPDITILNKAYGEKVCIDMYVLSSEIEKNENILTELTNGNIKIEKTHEVYV